MKQFLLYLIFTIIMIFVNGFVIMKVWNWFINPYFGLMTLNLPMGIGIGLLAQSMTGSTQYNEQTEEERVTSLIMTIIVPILILITGFITQLFL